MLGYFIKYLDQQNYCTFRFLFLSYLTNVTANAFVSGMQEDVSIPY